MRQQASCRLRTGLATAIAPAVGAMASADTPGALPEHRSRDILAQVDAPPEEPGWIARNIALDSKSGVRISRALSFGIHRFDLRLRGPIYKTPLRKSNYGLKLEMKF